MYAFVQPLCDARQPFVCIAYSCEHDTHLYICSLQSYIILHSAVIFGSKSSFVCKSKAPWPRIFVVYTFHTLQQNSCDMPNQQLPHEDGVNGPTGSHAHPLPASGKSDGEDSSDTNQWHMDRRSPSLSRSSRSEHEDHARTSNAKHCTRRRIVTRSRSPMMRKSKFSKST